MKALVTGANGFVGSALCVRLKSEGLDLNATVRNADGSKDRMVVGEIGPDTNWQKALEGVDVVVHLAARVHHMQDNANDSLAAYRAVNTEATLNLARQAASAGAKRLIYLSSIKVNGEGCARPYTEADRPMPQGAYAVSKHEAEVGLLSLARESGLEVVILRPPLVYGPRVKANFLSMMRWIYKGVPLPLAGIRNARSLVALDNLVDLIAICLRHPEAANRVFLVGDGEDLSTPELLEKTAAAMGKRTRLFEVPTFMLNLTGRLTGKPEVIQRLLSSLQVDITNARQTLGWAPPVSVDRALQATVEYFLAHNAR